MSAAADDPMVIWALAALAIGLCFYLVYPALNRKRWTTSFDFSAQALLCGLLGVAVLLSYVEAVLLPAYALAILVHEYGHVLACRLAGHRAPRLRIAPFGGVAYSNERPASQAETAFIALMGPGFSAALLVIVSIAATALTGADRIVLAYTYDVAGVIGYLNVLNLLPFFPLDGGKALRAVTLSLAPRSARTVSLVMAALLGAYAAAEKFWLLLIFAGLGLIQAARSPAREREAAPMRASVALLTLCAHAALFALHFLAWRPNLLELLR